MWTCMGEVLKSGSLVSAGGVIFRTASDGNYDVALIADRRVWCLPKGLIEVGETPEATAVREVREETGLEGEIVDKLGEISYSFVRNKRYFKTVHFYLLRLIGGSPEQHDSEVEQVKWFRVQDALRVLAYVNERRMVKRAEEILSNRKF